MCPINWERRCVIYVAVIYVRGSGGRELALVQLWVERSSLSFIVGVLAGQYSVLVLQWYCARQLTVLLRGKFKRNHFFRNKWVHLCFFTVILEIFLYIIESWGPFNVDDTAVPNFEILLHQVSVITTRGCFLWNNFNLFFLQFFDISLSLLWWNSDSESWDGLETDFTMTTALPCRFYYTPENKFPKYSLI